MTFWLKDWKLRPDLFLISSNRKSDECPELEPFLMRPPAPSLSSSSTEEVDEDFPLPESSGEFSDGSLNKSLDLLNSMNPLRRRFAVYLLKRLSIEEIDLYLPQLVQALRYEDFEKIKEDLHSQLLEKFDDDYRIDRIRGKIKSAIAQLFKFSDLRKVASCQSLKIEDVFYREEISRGKSWTSTGNLSDSDEESESLSYPEGGQNNSLDLASFLIDVCTKDPHLSNNFYWYLMIECESKQNEGLIDIQEMYVIVLKRFLMKLEHGTTSEKRRFDLLQENFEFTRRLSEIFTETQALRGSRIKMTERITEKLEEYNKDMYASGKKILVPVDPKVTFDRFVPEKTEIFKAENLPCKLTLRLSGSILIHTERQVIYKNGDDLRQDALVLQMIRLFDRIWKGSNLDLKLTPYAVIPTSTTNGFVEFVESKSVSNVISEYGSIDAYFASAESGCTPRIDMVENFIKSCAGYSVITYVLGVGDRHLDNLLITPEGKLFHVDFEYILGFDPKPLPPPMKLTKEMIDAMGGYHSRDFRRFRNYSRAAYLLLRRNSDLIINLFASSSVALSSTKLSPLKLIARLKERLSPDLKEEEASKRLDHLISLSSSAVLATFLERLHGLAQSMRT